MNDKAGEENDFIGYVLCRPVSSPEAGLPVDIIFVSRFKAGYTRSHGITAEYYTIKRIYKLHALSNC